MQHVAHRASDDIAQLRRVLHRIQKMAEATFPTHNDAERALDRIAVECERVLSET